MRSLIIINDNERYVIDKFDRGLSVEQAKCSIGRTTGTGDVQRCAVCLPHKTKLCVVIEELLTCYSRYFAKSQKTSAGLTIVPVVPSEGSPAAGPPTNYHLLYHAVLVCERLENVHKPQVSCSTSRNV